MAALIHQFSAWYLSQLGHGGYWLIAALMTLESTLVPIPSEVIIPPAAYLAHTQGHLSIIGIVAAGTAGCWLGATIMYSVSRWVGRPFLLRFGPYFGIPRSKIELAERWAAHYGWAGVVFSRILPVIRHLIGIPAGVVRMDYRRYALATLAGSSLWCSVLAGLGVEVGRNQELLVGSIHRFTLLALAICVVLSALYYWFVHRPVRKLQS